MTQSVSEKTDKYLAITAIIAAIAFGGGLFLGIYMTLSHVRMEIINRSLDCRSEISPGVFSFWRSRKGICHLEDSP